MDKSRELERRMSRSKTKGIQNLEITFFSSKVCSSQHCIHSKHKKGSQLEWEVGVK